jgi:hypothetical protein
LLKAIITTEVKIIANNILSLTVQNEAVNSKTDRPSSTYLVTFRWTELPEVKSKKNMKLTDEKYTAKPGYNDIGLCETSSIESDICWYQIIPLR